jgi:hypothetical protein
MLITQPIIPIKAKSEIATMFGIAEEEDVTAVMPAVTKHGRVYDMGVVSTQSGPKRLFQDVAADRNDFFGSLEWVRNVDQIDAVVKVYCTKNSAKASRNVVWSHAEYSVYDTGDRNEGARTIQEITGFYNPNVGDVVNTTQRAADYITDKIEEQA